MLIKTICVRVDFGKKAVITFHETDDAHFPVLVSARCGDSDLSLSRQFASLNLADEYIRADFPRAVEVYKA